MSKKYLATEETHERIAMALEALSTAFANVDVIGAKGEQGTPGTTFTLSGIYPTYEAMIAANPNPKNNEGHLVGTTTNNVVYLYNSTTQLWENIGPITGVKGEKGDKGDKGEKGDKGDVAFDLDTGYASEIEDMQTLSKLDCGRLSQLT